MPLLVIHCPCWSRIIHAKRTDGNWFQLKNANKYITPWTSKDRFSHKKNLLLYNFKCATQPEFTPYLAKPNTASWIHMRCINCPDSWCLACNPRNFNGKPLYLLIFKLCERVSQGLTGGRNLALGCTLKSFQTLLNSANAYVLASNSNGFKVNFQ